MAKKDQLERVLYNHTMVPNTPELKNVDLAQYDFPFDQASMNTFVLGIIESSDEDGQLYFVDDTYRIPIVLQSADALPPIGDLYLLKKFRLIEEDLSYTHITGDTVQLYSTYIVSSRSQPSLRVSPALAEAVHHFTEATGEGEKEVKGRSNDEDNISPPIEVDLMMQTGNLRYWPQLKIGNCFLPSTVMHFTPVSYASENTASPPAGPTRPVYQVTDVLRPDQNDGPNMQVIQDRYFQDLIHVQGIVISKMFCETQITRAEAYERAEELYRRLGVGTGQASRTILIRLRQINGLDTFDIYVNMTSRPYPLGIIPGALVSFYNLVRRQHATGGIYGQAMMSTTIESRDDTVHDSYGIPVGLYDPEDYSTFTQMARWVFVAEATVDVMDGTAEARLFIESDEHVIRLLHLSSNTIETLKETALEHGILTYDSWIAGDSWGPEDGDQAGQRRGKRSVSDCQSPSIAYQGS
ncbi:hypothetical protein BX666DRAFT_1879657 [Dichotomocladium elegans]|nr:hypothetical protein BX666DRAFT_1879657 [Dichotomocladium elegans]